MRWTWLLAFGILAFPNASAAAVEVPLPPDAKAPLALAFDEEGRLWVTLDGTWAVARYDPATNRTDVVPLAAAKAGENDSLFGIAMAPDGAVWTGSGTHIHHVDPTRLHATAFKLPHATLLPGGVHVASDGTVYYAEVEADRVVRLDPASGQLKEILPPSTPFGPVAFAESPNGLILTATYAGTYGRLDPTTDTITAGPAKLVSGPVGIARSGDVYWVAEMGGDSIARVNPGTNELVRFPTTPSAYYPNSGPSDVLVAQDGAIWFAEHFADRVARFDPTERTLQEYAVPNTPGTNVQRLAEAPDGNIWFAEWSKHRLGYVRHEPRDPGFSVPDGLSVKKGGRVSFSPTTTSGPIPDGALLVGTGETPLRATVQGHEIVVDATNATAGTYQLLVSGRKEGMNVGRYVTVTVTGGSSPGLDAPMMLFVLVGLGLLGRRLR
jgi:virginiamycin B lyase